MPNPNVTVSIEADTQPFLNSLQSLQKLSASFGSQLTGALKSAAADGKELDSVLRKLALNLAGSALNHGLAPLQNMIGSMFSGFTGGLQGLMPFAKGGVVPFALGGVVSSPTYFPAGGKLGLMGEAGAEAIMPLRRGADGRLGVAAGGGSPVNVTSTSPPRMPVHSANPRRRSRGCWRGRCRGG
jgi:phage-related minor tail protein